MVARQSLTLFVKVRVLVPQPNHREQLMFAMIFYIRENGKFPLSTGLFHCQRHYSSIR